MEPAFAFDPAAEERAMPGVLLLFERTPSSEERVHIEAALPRALVGLFSLEWPDARRMVIVADDVFLWDDFGSGKYAKAVRALGAAAHRIVPVAVVASDAQRGQSEEALRAAPRALPAPAAPRPRPRVTKAKARPGATAEAHAPSVPTALDPSVAPAWTEAMTRLEAAAERDVVRAAHVCSDVKAKGKPLASLETKDAILAVLRDPTAAKVSSAQLGAALGAPFVMVAELDLALAERLVLALIEGSGTGVIAPVVRTATRALAGSTRDEVLAQLVRCAVRDPWCRDGLVRSRHPRATDAVLAEAEALLDRLSPRAAPSGADRAPADEEALTHPASALLDIACARDREAARARFATWRAQGGVRGLAAVKGLLGLLPPAELAATGLVPFTLAMRRVNDPALDEHAKWIA